MNLSYLKRLIFLRGFCHPLVNQTIFRLFGGYIPSRGFTVDTNNKHMPPANAASIFWGLYERAEVRFIQKYLRPDLDVVELGSSLGYSSLHIIRAQMKGRKLVCVEANPYMMETIKSNIALNAPWKNVVVLNRAIDYSGKGRVHFNVTDNNLGSHVDEKDGAGRIAVETTTLSELLGFQGIREFSLISDVEGAEAGIITEDLPAMQLCRQMIIELHPASLKGRTFSVEDLRHLLEFLTHDCW